MEALQAIHARKSVRSFTGEPIDRDLIDKLVRAGMAAPSAMNSQPWEIIVIDDRAKCDALANALPYAKMLFKAGIGIVVCANLKRALPAPMTDFWIQDCAAVTQNILLAAEALGLGAVWTGVHPVPATMDIVRSVIELPEDIIPFCVIPVGHPAGDTSAKDKFDDKKLHFNQW